jgi:hypothetical protein
LKGLLAGFELEPGLDLVVDFGEQVVSRVRGCLDWVGEDAGFWADNGLVANGLGADNG